MRKNCNSFLLVAVLIAIFTPFFSFHHFCQWMHLKAAVIASSLYSRCNVCNSWRHHFANAANCKRSYCVKCVCATHWSGCIHVSTTNKNMRCFLLWKLHNAHPHFDMQQRWSEWQSFYLQSGYCVFACQHQTKVIPLERCHILVEKTTTTTSTSIDANFIEHHLINSKKKKQFSVENDIP